MRVSVQDSRTRQVGTTRVVFMLYLIQNAAHYSLFSSFSCLGVPLRCFEITNSISCGNAPGCVWSPRIETAAPSPAPQCNVGVDFSCKNTKDETCSTVRAPPDIRCATGQPIFNLVLRYMGGDCAEDSNQQGDSSTCEDQSDINQSLSAKIVCVDADTPTTAMDVTPNVVMVGGRILITNANVGPLPDRVSCVIANSSTNRVHQVIVINTSGDLELDLKDRYGALEVDGCDSLQCSDTWTWSTSVVNTGTTSATVNQLTYNLTIDDGASEEVDLFATFTPRQIAPDSAVAAQDVTRVMDLCTMNNVTAFASVSATEQGTEFANPCSDTKQLTQMIEPDFCRLNVSLTCTSSGSGFSGKNCSEITRETRTRCACSQCARELRFRYTGNMCGTNVAGSGITCRNVTSSVPQDRALISFKRGFADLLRAEVELGEDVIFSNNGNCLPDTFTIYIVRVGSSPVVTQTIDLNTRCSTSSFGQVLLTDLGALRFSGYSCDLTSDVHNCYEDVDYVSCVENDGTTSRELSSFNLVVNTNETDLLRLGSFSSILTPGDHNCVNVPADVERCRVNAVVATASATAVVDSKCPSGTASQQVEFTVGNPPFPAPTRAPTIAIGPAPAPSPVIAPTAPSACPPSSAFRPVFAPPLPTNCP